MTPNQSYQVCKGVLGHHCDSAKRCFNCFSFLKDCMVTKIMTAFVIKNPGPAHISKANQIMFNQLRPATLRGLIRWC